jgi:hypothetical protein
VLCCAVLSVLLCLLALCSADRKANQHTRSAQAQISHTNAASENGDLDVCRSSLVGGPLISKAKQSLNESCPNFPRIRNRAAYFPGDPPRINPQQQTSIGLPRSIAMSNAFLALLIVAIVACASAWTAGRSLTMAGDKKKVGVRFTSLPLHRPALISLHQSHCASVDRHHRRRCGDPSGNRWCRGVQGAVRGSVWHQSATQPVALALALRLLQ